MARFNDLPDKDLYPYWRAALIRDRIRRALKSVVNFTFTIACIAAVIYISVVLI